MTYTPEQVAELERGCQEILRELEEVWLSLASDFAPSLTVERAREYLGNGVCRRLKTIRRCIDNIFTIFPVDRTTLLSEEERSDLQINLHAFTINISGLPDNLAWIYISEKGFTFTPIQVSLFNEEMQKVLPAEFRAYLGSENIKAWHKDYAKTYRDALAHRIPLYVPPSISTPIHEQRYRELYEEITKAVRNCNFERAKTLGEEQDALGSICPAFLHSFSDTDACPPILLHPQVIADARTVIEIIGMFRKHVV